MRKPSRRKIDREASGRKLSRCEQSLHRTHPAQSDSLVGQSLVCEGIFEFAYFESDWSGPYKCSRI